MVFIGIFDIDWQSFWLGEENWKFLSEVTIRSVIMFLVILFSLRILGKRSIAQLSVFELCVLIGLGSATGDPMFYKDVGLLPCIMAFVIVISMYRLFTFLTNRSRAVDKTFEGQPSYIVEEGKLNVHNFKAETLSHEEFFAQLRLENVTQLGQVEYAILETTGHLSVIYYPEEKIKWGLPLLPHLYENKLKELSAGGIFSCFHCGHVVEIKNAVSMLSCTYCEKEEWVPAIHTHRVT